MKAYGYKSSSTTLYLLFFLHISYRKPKSVKSAEHSSHTSLASIQTIARSSMPAEPPTLRSSSGRYQFTALGVAHNHAVLGQQIDEFDTVDQSQSWLAASRRLCPL